MILGDRLYRELSGPSQARPEKKNTTSVSIAPVISSIVARAPCEPNPRKVSPNLLSKLRLSVRRRENLYSWFLRNRQALRWVNSHRSTARRKWWSSYQYLLWSTFSGRCGGHLRQPQTLFRNRTHLQSEEWRGPRRLPAVDVLTI